MKINFACALLVAACLVYVTVGSADFTQSFLPRAFGPTGDILKMETVWNTTGILQQRFDTPVQNNNYIQANFLYFMKGSSSVATPTLNENTIQFASPTSVKGEFGFQWETFTRGVLWDSRVESGSGQIEFSMKEYRYGVRFAETANKRFNATIVDFVCNFDITLNPTWNGTPRDITRTLFPNLRAPINATLNNFFCSRILAQLQLRANNLLTEAQNSQTFNWAYGGFTARKTINLNPTNTSPFKDGNFVITSNGNLALAEDGENDTMLLQGGLLQISDDSLKVQNDDICFIFTDELINSLISTNVNFFGQYKILLNDKSNFQRYYPFNLWQFWEATLYDQELFKLIGTEPGKFRQTDPISMSCSFTAPTKSSMITTDGNMQITLNYHCTLDIKDSLDGNKIKPLYSFTFDHVMTAKFYLVGITLNARVETGEVRNLSMNFLDDLRQRFQMPLNIEIQNNALLFGQTGLKFSYILNKQIRPAKVGENLEICMF